jgi:hypothetical protein
VMLFMHLGAHHATRPTRLALTAMSTQVRPGKAVRKLVQSRYDCKT